MQTTKSADGTVIAYDRTGDGPPLVVAVGAFCDRGSFVPPDDLTSRFTVYTYDRRGRGDSGDTGREGQGKKNEELRALRTQCEAECCSDRQARRWLREQQKKTKL